MAKNQGPKQKGPVLWAEETMKTPDDVRSLAAYDTEAYIPDVDHQENGPMNKSQYRTALKKLGLSIVGAAPYLGISRRNSQRIAAGDCEVPKPVAKLLRVAVAHEIPVEELLE